MVERQAVNLDDAGSNPAKSVNLLILIVILKPLLLLLLLPLKKKEQDFYKYKCCKDVDCASLLLRQLGLTHASVVS